MQFGLNFFQVILGLWLYYFTFIVTIVTMVTNISGPVQLYHAKSDDHVPYELSLRLENLMKEVEKEVEFYTYETDDYNLPKNLNLALNRSVDFFDRYLKGGD